MSGFAIRMVLGLGDYDYCGTNALAVVNYWYCLLTTSDLDQLSERTLGRIIMISIL